MSSELGTGSIRVLFVCSANISRSAAAEALLRQHLQGFPVQVSSAGFLPGGRSADMQTALAVGDYGADLSAHISRRITAEILMRDGRDLVIAMCRSHLREIVVNDPSLWPRVVTLKELSRVVRRLKSSDVIGLDQILAGRRMSAMIGDDPVDDVADVHGMALELHREMVTNVHQLTSVVARWMVTVHGW
jgi:protein-tyrosine phosphatase